MIPKLIKAFDNLPAEEKLRLISYLLQSYEQEARESKTRELQGIKEKRNVIEYNTDGNLANLTDAATCHNIPLTFNAFAAVRELDLQFIGTDQYMGVAYFWHHDYKFTLRQATPRQRRITHHEILRAGFQPNEHNKTITKIIAKLDKRITNRM